ncbi:MAG: hypothetical protein HYU53_18705 [Acidobacteria bacterium]|nr:hypothetical protein [Acidobacteriota bacterium]
MKRIAVASLVALTVACSADRETQPQRPEPDKGRMAPRSRLEGDFLKEAVILYVWLDARDGKCKLREKVPGEIRAQSGSAVKWFIEGSCEGAHTITIDRRLKRGGVLKDLFEGIAPIEAPATDGQVMSATVRKIEEGEKGLYRYRVFIDGQPAQYNSEARDGTLAACPTWPCGDFEFDY